MKTLKNYSLLAALILLVGCAASAPPGVGVWNVDMNTPLGAQSFVLTLNDDGSGSMESPQGTQAIDGIVYDGNAVEFSAALEAQGQSITLDFSGTVAGDSIEGAFNTPFGALDATGTRQ